LGNTCIIIKHVMKFFNRKNIQISIFQYDPICPGNSILTKDDNETIVY
jgi:hypothetical protein